MIINISEKKIVSLILNDGLEVEDIAQNERNIFLKNHGNSLMLHYFNQNNSSELAKLLDYEPIEDLLIKEVRSFNSIANINYIESLPENSVMTYFIWSMSKQNAFNKENFFNKIYPLLTKYKSDFKKFFSIRLGEEKSSFPKGQPIGMFFLRVLDKQIDSVLDSGVISLDLFSPITNDTLAHNLHGYNYEVSKAIIDRVTDIDQFFKDKNKTQHTGIDKLMNDLRERNIQTLEYLFSEILDLNNYQKDFMNYVVKSANVLKNSQTSQALKDRLLLSLNNLFNLPKLQNDVAFKPRLAEKIASIGSVEIHYLWLNAKFPEKGIEEKRLKI